MGQNYDEMIAKAANHVFEVMAKRVSDDELKAIRSAYELAYEAHSQQRRKSGEPYIIHPIAVATIAAEELNLGANSVMAAFLHDVVEDTEYTVEDIRKHFGDDVAFLVDVVTKKNRKEYRRSKQVDNYQQLLDSLSYDIRALMIKIADRLHNMRTLASMRPDKQMKIAGETDYFYAPLANRLGLFDVKTDLENLSFKYRCGMQYADIKRELTVATMENSVRLSRFTRLVENTLADCGITANAKVYWRQPYSIWRRMNSQKKDFRHIENPYYIRVTFDHTAFTLSEKDICLKIYSILTSKFKEKPLSFNNLIDIAKENSYQSINVMLLSAGGIWEDIQICSEHMVEMSRLGCMADVGQNNVKEWIKKFKLILKDIATQSHEQSFIEKVVTSLYYDDVMVLTPQGNGIILPKGATALDFAFELHTDIGLHAKYARINGKLLSIKTELKRGDCVEIGTDDTSFPKKDWLEYVCTYKAKRTLNSYFAQELAQQKFTRCPHCLPLPGGETIGFREDDGSITMHRRNCPVAIEQASKYGDSIVDIEFPVKPNITYPITINIRAVDRYHFLVDIVDMITNHLHLSIDSLHTVTRDDIVECTVIFFIHSVKELVISMQKLYTIEGVDEVNQVLG